MEHNAIFVTGVDLGDRYSQVCVLDERGEVVAESRVQTTPAAFERVFGAQAAGRVALEVGTHSPWVSRLLSSQGHEVVVANARQLRLIYGSDHKNDRNDAELLARVARMDPKLLCPIQHRSEQCQAVRAEMRARAALVESRTKLINHVRGTVKAMGGRIRKCSGESFHKRTDEIPEQLTACLLPMMDVIRGLTGQIRAYDARIAQVSEEKFPETDNLRQADGVGSVTALAFIVALEDPGRFDNGRAAAAFLGLTPRQSQSGDKDPQLGITKAGDQYVRCLLVQSAHRILGPFGKDSDLRRWGLRLAERGGNNAKKRAVVAVARKLAVVLYKLWSSGEDYEPLRAESMKNKKHHKAA